MGEQSNRINPSSRQEYERGNFSCTITKNAKEKNEWDDPKEAHPGRLAVPAPGTAQTGTDGGGGGGGPRPWRTHAPQQGLGLKTCWAILKGLLSYVWG